MPGESVPQGLWLPPRVATLLVAASDALDRIRAQADYLCDGVDDEVQINAALNALPASGGTVVLSEGNFVIADPITIPANNITLSGQGRSTFINGNALLTTEHGIVLDGFTNCTVRDLTIQTQNGGGKVCHCIHIANGANSTNITQVIFAASDEDGIHIDGTTMYDVTIRQCTFLTDIDDHGIFIDLTAANTIFRTTIHDNLIQGTGQEGIEFGATGAGHIYCEVTDNIIFVTDAVAGISINGMTYSDLSNNFVYGAATVGIELLASSYCTLEGNMALSNTTDGITFTNCDECILTGNLSHSNGSEGILIDVNSAQNKIEGNHVCHNTHDGIEVLGLYNTIDNNYCHENGYHGILCGGANCKIGSNYCIDNSQGAADNYHGICITADGDYCHIEGNFCWGGPDHNMQEDGIYLTDGAVHCSIVGNFCYYMSGDGIHLAGNNTGTLVDGNKCHYMEDENGIVVEDSIDCQVTGNHCMDNCHHGIFLHNADWCNCTGNTCNNNDRLNGGIYDGISLNTESIECLLSGNYCYSNGRCGIYLAGGNTDCSIIGNHCNTNALHGIYLTAESDFCVITGNKCKSNGTHGIFVLESSYCTITGNVCNLHADDDGIRIEGDATHEANYNIVSSNVCTGNADGIELAGVAADDCKKTVVIGNQLLGNTANALVDGGQNTEIGHNITV
ncbi:hypothetical protein ES703_21908 [subsurface metagenome]